MDLNKYDKSSLNADIIEIVEHYLGENSISYGVDTAIKSLRPGSTFDVTVSGGKYNFHKWHDPNKLPPPSNEEINDEYNFQKSVAEYVQYRIDRVAEYPDGYDQLDMLWHAINAGIDLKDSEWFKTIKKIKDRYPKPSGPKPERKSRS